MRVLLPLAGVGLCLASNATDTAASALHALRGAAAAFVHEAKAAVDAAFGDGNATGAAARRLGAPPTAMGYKGIDWAPISVYGTGVKHIFAIGDWGGMDGSLSPCCGRPAIIAYAGGHTPGPHVFPRSRWNRAHSELLCTHKQFVECFDTRGSSCAAGCGFVPEIDMQPQFLVANAFRARAAMKNPDYILNVGDNFYWGGIEIDCGSTPMSQISGTARHQFDQVFEGIYQGAGLSNKPWLSILGNHDWGGRQFYNGCDQQIAYTWASNRWRMPAPYWSQHVSYPDLGFDVDIIMHDSNAMDAKDPGSDPEHNMCSRKHNRPDASCASTGGPASVDSCKAWFWGLYAEQKPWVESKLAHSKADWQIMVTHFPCGHDSGWYRSLHTRLGLDLLVTGHRHDQELGSNWGALGGMMCIVTGGGGGITSEASPWDRTHWYGEAQYGFYDLAISKDKIFIESINYDGKVLKSATVTPSR